jgi:hypothetical protein
VVLFYLSVYIWIRMGKKMLVKKSFINKFFWTQKIKSGFLWLKIIIILIWLCGCQKLVLSISFIWKRVYVNYWDNSKFFDKKYRLLKHVHSIFTRLVILNFINVHTYVKEILISSTSYHEGRYIYFLKFW